MFYSYHFGNACSAGAFSQRPGFFRAPEIGASVLIRDRRERIPGIRPPQSRNLLLLLAEIAIEQLFSIFHIFHAHLEIRAASRWMIPRIPVRCPQCLPDPAYSRVPVGARGAL